MTLAIRADIEEMLGKVIAVRLYTDSKSLFDVITKNSVTTEKRLMIDVRSVREAYVNMELNNVAWIRSEYNPADALTKVKDNLVLTKAIDEGFITHPVEQWVVRSTEQVPHAASCPT